MLDICLYTDIPEDEREDIVALESYEVKLDRLFNTYAAIMEAAELNIREAELKCFEESGDMDDLEEYYKEAEEKTAEQSKGIFQKIKEGIVAFFRKISSSLSGKKDKVSDEGETEAPAGLLGFAQKIINAFKSGFGKLKNALVNHKVGAGVVAAGGVVVATFAFINRDAIKNITESGKKERISKKAGKEAGEGLAQAAKDIADACDQVDASKPDEETKKLFGRLRTIGSCIQSAGSTLLDFCVGAKSAIKDKFSKDDENESAEGETESNKKPNGDKRDRKNDNGKAQPKRTEAVNNAYQKGKAIRFDQVNSQKILNLLKADANTVHKSKEEYSSEEYYKNRGEDAKTFKGKRAQKKADKAADISAESGRRAAELAAGDKVKKYKELEANFKKETEGKSEAFKKMWLKKHGWLTFESEEDDIFDDDLFTESFDDDFDSLLDGMFEESEEEDDEDNFVEESEDDFWNNNADSFFEEAEEIDDLLNTLFIGESFDEEGE